MEQTVSIQQHEIKKDTNTVLQQNNILQHPACQLLEQQSFIILNMQVSEFQKTAEKPVDMRHTTLWWNMIGQHLNTPEQELSLIQAVKKNIDAPLFIDRLEMKK